MPLLTSFGSTRGLGFGSKKVAIGTYDLITPSSITTSGTASINNGVISFSGASTTLNGIFSDNYDFYDIYIKSNYGVGSTSQYSLYYKLASNGTLASSTSANRRYIDYLGASTGYSANSSWLGESQGYGQYGAYIKVTVAKPFDATTKPTTIEKGVTDASSSYKWKEQLGQMVSSGTAYDGFHIYGGASLNGEIKVFGYGGY